MQNSACKGISFTNYADHGASMQRSFNIYIEVDATKLIDLNRLNDGLYPNSRM